VLGAMILQGIGEGTFVIPGTHSKRIIVEGGRITGFRSFMTGELFAALLDHTILGRLAAGRAHDDDGFAQGVATARSAHEAGAGPGDLMNLVFSARTRVLAGGLREGAVASYLSGLLIGAELMSHRTVLAGRRRDGQEGGGVWLIADGVLGERRPIG
jgi:2-dehydro-3-deoxygalactonokinase